ncbi:hypothetical protein GTCCBUS3UF5_15130 [Geobacillus thermoleovorans CCB_US3_UF5]|uniref:Uncharacterized protein n=1 Tax=Geobacillus thermoleovorans CCB_US3_UF5 TaxID=1111068 RepID=A0ABM5MGJ2_GEOTH|nr:hypothetical protein GTCCBUS3UF5_15130 [Geobacillus thermoleovorans CCB_US3_UF5]
MPPLFMYSLFLIAFLFFAAQKRKEDLFLSTRKRKRSLLGFFIISRREDPHFHA